MPAPLHLWLQSKHFKNNIFSKTLSTWVAKILSNEQLSTRNIHSHLKSGQWCHSLVCFSRQCTEASWISTVLLHTCKLQTEHTSHLFPAYSTCTQIITLSTTCWNLRTKLLNSFKVSLIFPKLKKAISEMQVLFVSFSDMWHLLLFSVFIWQVIKFKTCYAEDGRDMNTGMKASSGWMDCSTELIPLSHPNADQWESLDLFARLHFEPHSHIQQAHRGLTSQWLHTDCFWKCDWMKLLSCHVTKNRYV